MPRHKSAEKRVNTNLRDQKRNLAVKSELKTLLRRARQEPGNASLMKSVESKLDRAVKKGVIVVTTTRTGSGRIAPPRRGPNAVQPSNQSAALTPDEQGRFIAGEDLAPVKARVLLMLALTTTKDPVDIQRIFSEY